MVASGASLFLIDGFPRALDQAHAFESGVQPCDAVLFFDCSEDAMRARLLERGKTSGRADDNEETIVKRFRTFVEQSKPVVEEFKVRRRLQLSQSQFRMGLSWFQSETRIACACTSRHRLQSGCFVLCIHTMRKLRNATAASDNGFNGQQCLQEKGKVAEISAEQTPDEVFEEVKTALDAVLA